MSVEVYAPQRVRDERTIADERAVAAMVDRRFEGAERVELLELLGLAGDAVTAEAAVDVPRRRNVARAGVCDAEGCDQPRFARGLCSRHYYAQLRAERKAVRS